MSQHELRFAAASPKLDISLCDQELIHTPGAIQPHGALLAVLADGWIVTHASANLETILGQPAEAALGRPLQEVIGEVACRALQDTMPRDPRTQGSVHLLPGPDGITLHLKTFRSGLHVCIDIEPIRCKQDGGMSIAVAQSILNTFNDAATKVDLCERAVRGLKAITGYDRVMAYRFAQDGHGEVIAEALQPELEPYLGLRYPAADIPPQARRQFLLQRVSMISDSSYQPVELLSDRTLDDGVPLDLTHSVLRSVSPYHREYMRNMKTAASLVIGLCCGEKLWGLLVCHSSTPLVAGPELRATAGMIGEVVSLLLGSLSEVEIHVRRSERNAILRKLIDQLAAPLPLHDALAAGEKDLLGLVDAAGALVRLDGAFLYFGRTPAQPLAERVFAILRGLAVGEVLAIDNFGLRYPELADCAGSGTLLVPLAHGTDDAVLWFRPELSQTVAWGGNPAEHARLDPVSGRLSPRASFAAWKDIVKGCSAPWAEADLFLARELHNAIEAEVARRAKAALFELRHYDSLTGLPNRRLLQEWLLEAGAMAGSGATLVFLDCHETIEVNQTMGQEAGDALLIEVARRLRVVAGPETLAVRLGGVEFAVLCCQRQPGEINEIIKQIRLTMAAPFDILGNVYQISPSIGSAVVRQSSELDLVGAADLAMHATRITIEAKRKSDTQRQKMETLGRMMGGVAHEINNMLQPVTLLVQEIIDTGLIVEAGKGLLDVVLDCNKKARLIVGDMLAFSTPAAPTTEMHDPIELLNSALPIVERAIPAGVVLSTLVKGDLPPVMINRTSFVQILLNLANNAAVAMDGQGEVTIALEESRSETVAEAMGQQSSFVRLRVIDTGCGMDKMTADRAFEPFFTTKPVGQGTGLGLPVVYGLVREMGATIVLDSKPDLGTTVTILIPGQNGKMENGVYIDN
jgi:diguanylate cyclase (GGDEF)-like protein